jgi:phage/plasmid-like protein (TIGR03299 family)
MAHEIQIYDNPVYHAEPAWHGLGLVVADAPTPREALTLAGLEWGVEQKALHYYDAQGKEVKIDSHVINIRDDKPIELGVVSSGYRPIQNIDMADFCEALLADKIVRCESVGSINNGKKVWFLLKGADFGVKCKRDDRICPYICVSNGHDGGSAFRVTPTTIRVVCSNTLHMVIPNQETGELMDAAIMFRHTTNIKERVEQARNALAMYGMALKGTADMANHLAAKNVKSEDLEKFFLECYTNEFNEIPANPQDAKEERRVRKAQSAFDSFSMRFDDEQVMYGANAWTMFNAMSGVYQHDQKARGKDDCNRVAKRVQSNLFGLAQSRTLAAFRMALQS